jgi:hypothetical protein
LLDSTIDKNLKNAGFPLLRQDFIVAATDSNSIQGFSYQNIGEVPVVIQSGDTLFSLAKTYAPLMGMQDPVNAAIKIAAFNNMLGTDNKTPWQDVKINAGDNIYIPVDNNIELLPKDSLSSTFKKYSSTEIASQLATSGLLPVTLAGDAVATGKLLEELNPGQFDENGIMTGNALDKVPVHDDFAHVKPLATPELALPATSTLVVAESLTEGQIKDHMNITHDFARSYARALSGDSGWQEILAYNEPKWGDIYREIQPHIGKDANSEYLIISQSYNSTAEYDESTGLAVEDFMNFKAYRENPALMDTGIIHFIAAGNNAATHPGQHLAMPEQLGGRAVIVGAVHEMIDDVKMLADYSSPGADILAPPIAMHSGQPITGTSYATPMMAALDKQMLDRYGGTLTPEEIMAAAYMSTDMDLSQRSYDIEKKQIFTHPVAFETNGGGRPHNDRAGAGMIDPEKWQENLETMTKMKLSMQHNPDFRVDKLSLGDQVPEVENQGVNYAFKYTVTIPADMTLDRLSLLVQQQDGKEGKISITSPSGFTYDMPHARSAAVGTSAFALEDVRAGDKITITVTGEPLSKDAAIVVRGYEDGNVIQTLRDYLMERDQMPKPNTDYLGAEPSLANISALEALKTLADALSVSSNLSTPDNPQRQAPPTALPDIKF